MKDKNGVLDIDLDDLFKDDPAVGTPPADDKTQLNLTEAMTKRINEVRTKTEQEVRDKIAKSLGYDSYEALEKAKDKKHIIEAGYEPEEIEKLIEPLLEKRLASDPRLQKLQQYEEQEQKTYINSQLAEIEKLTGVKVVEADLPPETIELWKKGVDLSKAYIATNPTKILSSATKGSTAHLAGSSSTGATKTRTLTQVEKDFYKSINPTITDEELNKKTIEVK